MTVFFQITLKIDQHLAKL